MIKQLSALAIAAASFSASATNIEYTLTGPISGTVVQGDNQSVVYYNLNLAVPSYFGNQPFHIQLAPRAVGQDSITFESTYSRAGGITNFGVIDTYDGDQFTSFSTYFSTATNGNYLFKTDFSSRFYTGQGWVTYSDSYKGYVTPRPVDADIQAVLDQNGGIQPYLVGRPVQFIGSAVPEPGSLALLGIGMLGALGVARRRKA